MITFNCCRRLLNIWSTIVAETRKTMAIRVIKAREAFEAATRAKTNAESAHKRAQAALWENLNDADETTVTIELGDPYGKVSFTKRETIRANILAERRAEAVASIRASGLADALLSDQPNFNGKALNDHVREWIKNGNPLPDGIDFSSTKYVNVSMK